jgi:redox-sensitive bicupin YhaK (pirin superfamily)
MSGPVTTQDTPPASEDGDPAAGPVVELEPGRITEVGTMPVRRVLPHRPRRTVGAWCFADHVGPVAAAGRGLGIGPHPHMGLQTVTWLVAGELVHLDSLGSEQPIRPGQLNLMTAGRGVAHAEEDPGRARELHGVQLWVAQPEETRHGPPAFEHHGVLPVFELQGAVATVLVGDFGGVQSTARRDTEHVGVELAFGPPGSVLPLRRDYEHALIVLEGSLRVDREVVEPGVLAYLGAGRDECRVDALEPGRALLLGGVPFPEALLMWWNFVARTKEEVSEARREWTAGTERFGTVRSHLDRIEVGPPPWE